MRVRVYDKEAGIYFKSQVYAIVNTGWYERYLVLQPMEQGACLRLYDCLDKSEESRPVLVNVILPERPESWVRQDTGSVERALDGYADLLEEGGRFYSYAGDNWIWQDYELLTALLRGEAVPCPPEHLSDHREEYPLGGWSYVETQEDAGRLLEQCSGFHDSVLNGLDYVSGAYVDEDNSMVVTASLRKVTMRFDSQWCDSVEMVFEGVLAMNLRPAPDNYGSNIFSASVFVKDATVFFADEELSSDDEEYDGTWIRALSLRWRFVGQPKRPEGGLRARR